jgi:ABC-type branched-subunit amino acid transport system ATPase component
VMRLRPDVVSRRGVSWVPEDRRVFPGLTVRENIELARASARDGEVLTYAHLSRLFPILADLGGRDGGKLSGGQQQIVALARGLVARPRLLLLDEPTEGLAPLVVQHVVDGLKEVIREGSVSVLISEQNFRSVIALTSRIYVLERGAVIREVSSEELGSSQSLQRELLGVGAQA